MPKALCRPRRTEAQEYTIPSHSVKDFSKVGSGTENGVGLRISEDCEAGEHVLEICGHRFVVCHE